MRARASTFETSAARKARQDAEFAQAEAILKQHEIDRAEDERGQARPRAVLSQRNADNDMRGAPQDRDDGEREEQSGGQTRRHLATAALAGRDHGDGADPERQSRDADERGQQSPDDEEDADKVDVSVHIAAGRTATRSSTRTGNASRDRRRNRKHAPSATPGGTAMRTG